jgi:PAS domain-containing protein
MPDMSRSKGGNLRARPQRGGFLGRGFLAGLVAAMVLVPSVALALNHFSIVTIYLETFTTLSAQEIAALAVALGVLVFGVTTAILMMRLRAGAAAAQSNLGDDIIALRAERDRINTLLLSEPQILVTWSASGGEPHIFGDATLIASAALPQRVLAFGSWLEPDKAQAMDRAVAALRENGEAFSMGLMSLAGRAIDAEGRAIGGCAVLRLRDVTGFKRELAEVNAKYEKLAGSMESMRTLIEALPSPVWVRDVDGALTYVNSAYARAVEANDSASAISRGIELLDRTARDQVRSVRAGGRTYVGRVAAIAAGSRRIFDVIDVPTRKGSAGLGIDVTEIGEGPLELSDFRITSFRLRHPGTTLGFRIGPPGPGRELAYVTDNELGAGGEYPVGADWRQRLVAFLGGTDTLIHDAMYSDKIIHARAGWGHSTPRQAVDLASEARCRKLLLFHHEPEHSDDAIDSLLGDTREYARGVAPGLIVDAAAEGESFSL